MLQTISYMSTLAADPDSSVTISWLEIKGYMYISSSFSLFTGM